MSWFQDTMYLHDRSSRRVASVYLAFAFWILGALSAPACAQQVNLAGFAFAGAVVEAPVRFPYAYEVIEKISIDSASGPTAISRLVLARSRSVKNPSFPLNFDSLASLRDSDQALVAALVLTGETVFVEDFGPYHKVFVSLRGDALIFDYKSKTVIRAYPLHGVLFDAVPSAPTQTQLEAHVTRLLIGDDERSLLGQFVRVLSSASLPAPGTKTIQIRTAEISDNALAAFPATIRNPSVARAMLIDTFESSLSGKTGLPMVPSRVTHATGVMHVRFEDMYDYDLKIPQGDYTFDLKLQRLAKIQHSSNNVGASYIYGAFVNLEFSEPLLGQKFFSSDLKNGETAVVPAGRQNADDFPGYEDAIRGLFRKFAETLNRPDSKWIRSASATPDIEAQIRKTREILEISRL